MPTEITTVVNQQDLEVEVSGPAPANRMYLVSGIGKVDLAVLQPGATVKKDTFTVLVGPVLTSGQFVRAMATASPAAIKWFGGGDQNTFVAWRVLNVDADFDDETGRTKLGIEAEIELDFSRATIETIAFQATILAAI